MGEFGGYKDKGQATPEQVKDCLQILLKFSPTAITAFKFLSAILQCETWAKSLQMVTPLWVLITTLSSPMSIPTAIIQSSWTAQSHKSQKNKVISSFRTQSKNLITFRLTNHVIVSGGNKKP